MSIADNLERVRERIGSAAARVGRDPSGVTIIAVTKTHGPDIVTAAIEAGINDVGENRIQEFLEKSQAVSHQCRWHLVGHLQTNKVTKAVGRFELIHSVDSLKLAGRLSRVSSERGIETDILLEVNTSGEVSKFGFPPDETVDAFGRISELPALRARGLMTVGPWVEDEGILRAAFSRLRRLKEEIERSGTSIEHLSMGMTDDFEAAIEEGSTMVRLGRVLFGEREY
jgi:pyridoxal phosphate enzyme (YggS family)